MVKITADFRHSCTFSENKKKINKEIDGKYQLTITSSKFVFFFYGNS